MYPALPSSWESTRRYLFIRSALESRGALKCPDSLKSQIFSKEGFINEARGSGRGASFGQVVPCYVEFRQPWDEKTGTTYTLSQATEKKSWHILKGLAVYSAISPEKNKQACYYNFIESNPALLEEMAVALSSLPAPKNQNGTIIYWLEGELSMYLELESSLKRCGG